MSTFDRELVRRLLTGDERAFEGFFDDYFPGLYRFALARTGRDEDAAEEIAQATLCAAIPKLRTYRGEAALSTWLFTFCRHEISAFYRRTHKERPAVELVEDDPLVAAALESMAAASETGAEATVRRDETARLVHVLLDRLPPRYATALELKYIDGLSVNDIAARLEVSAKAAESLLTRARDAFREGFATITQAGKFGERT
jgi:RNA polymerase sigma-70 factor (ECF subfamily)